MIKILIVDDDKRFCEKVAEYFEELGHLAFTVTKPSDVVGVIEKEAPHVVLLDLFMPSKENGMGVLKEIKEKYGNTVKVVVVSVADDVETRAKAKTLGADEYVNKPFNNVYLRDVVMKRIEEALGYRGKAVIPQDQIPRILIADDEIEVVEDIKFFLNRVIECKVDTTKDGNETLTLINKNNYDLVFLDIKMPGLSGLDVMREARKTKELPDIIVVTAWDSTEVARKVLKEGALEYIPKPFSLENFKLKVKSVLEKKNKYFEKG